MILSFFFFNDTATTEIYTLSLHDALPISQRRAVEIADREPRAVDRFPHLHRNGRPERAHVFARHPEARSDAGRIRSEEHTSELQSQSNLVCRLLLEKKK